MLFHPITIKNIKLKNRFIAEPIVSNSGLSDGTPSEKTLDLYTAYAHSGAGMCVVEQHAVHPWGRNKLNQFRLYQDKTAADLQLLTAIFKKANIPVAAQLNFSGAGASGKELLKEEDFRLVSPSGLRNPRDLINADSQKLEQCEIQEIVDAFAFAAQRAVMIADYTGGVQIYACHGYLIGQFLSPLTNHRCDCYGGTIKNRARLLFEITEAVRAAVPNAVVSVRLGASDQMPGQPTNGLTLDESIWIAQHLVALGVDWIGISGNHCIYGIGENDNDTAYFAPYASAIRQALGNKKVPIDCAGGIRSIKRSEELLENKACDLIGIGRPLLKDKQFIRRLISMQQSLLL